MLIYSISCCLIPCDSNALSNDEIMTGCALVVFSLVHHSKQEPRREEERHRHGCCQGETPFYLAIPGKSHKRGAERSSPAPIAPALCRKDTNT
mmetsp:Transcript_14216/g.29462  ORF Transcript_14216/g.29462 Transcript_14216/m.29462 type:complete len:93 (+) Transcript_14216:546-824(+)